MNPDEGYNSDDPISRNDSSLDGTWRDIGSARNFTSNNQSNPDKKQHQEDARSSAVQSARSMENSALKKQDSTDKKDAKSAEQPKDNFISNVTGKKPKGFLKFLTNKNKLAPIIAILVIIGLVGGIIIASQGLAPFALVANGLDQFNSLRTSMNKRSNYFLTFALGRNGKNTSIVSKKYFGIFGPDKFKISGKTKSRLARSGITYIDDIDGNGTRALVYKSPDGKYTAIGANQADTDKIPSKFKMPDGAEVDLSNGSSKTSLSSAIDNIEGFRTNLDTSTRTMKGHISGWFDSVSDKFHDRIQNNRNRYGKTKQDATPDEVAADAKRTGLSEEIPESDSDNVKHKEEVPGVDEKGKPKTTIEDVKTKDAPDGIKKGTTDPTEIQNALNSRAKVLAASASATVDIACAAMKAMAGINAVISAIHVANVINYVTGLLNAIQQAQIDGNATPMNYYYNKLSQKGDTYDITGDEPIRRNTSALESPAYSQFFGGSPISDNDPLAQKFNKDYVAQASISASGVPAFIEKVSEFSSSTEAYKVCITAQATMAGIDIILDLMSLGVKQAATGTMKTLADSLKLPIIVGALGAIISFITPHVAKWMAMDLISNMVGEDAAYAINSGFNMYAGQQMQASSGMPGTKDQVIAQYKETQEVIALEAEYERNTKSPFDITSKNTFLGSIIHSAVPIGVSLYSPMKTISSAVGVFGSSIRNLMPTVSAASDRTWYELSINENCPSLSQIGLVGDAYCNPYFVSDYSTVAMDPGEVYENIDDSNFVGEDSNGNPQIQEKSELSKWVVSCAVRQSQFGVVDTSIITTSLSGNSAVDGAISMGLNFVPVLGSAMDLKDTAFQAANLEWANGQNCTKPEYKYFSRYSEDQRMMEAMGIIDKSAVTAFLEKYEEKHPLDHSLEGTIARYSGMSKEKVDETLNLMAYMNFIANYNPKEAGPLKYEELKESYQFESPLVVSNHTPGFINPQHVIYEDLRTRVKLV